MPENVSGTENAGWREIKVGCVLDDMTRRVACGENGDVALCSLLTLGIRQRCQLSPP